MKKQFVFLSPFLLLLIGTGVVTGIKLSQLLGGNKKHRPLVDNSGVTLVDTYLGEDGLPLINKETPTYSDGPVYNKQDVYKDNAGTYKKNDAVYKQEVFYKPDVEEYKDPVIYKEENTVYSPNNNNGYKDGVADYNKNDYKQDADVYKQDDQYKDYNQVFKKGEEYKDNAVIYNKNDGGNYNQDYKQVPSQDYKGYKDNTVVYQKEDQYNNQDYVKQDYGQVYKDSATYQQSEGYKNNEPYKQIDDYKPYEPYNNQKQQYNNVDYKDTYYKEVKKYYEYGGASRYNSCAPILSNVPIEHRSISELYSLALKEGGKMIIYAGGDSPEQATSSKTAFEARFPGTNIQMIVDYSKIHDARLDNQVARGNVIPDVIQLQTLQDYDRWKCEGILYPYKPKYWDQVYPEFKDLDGYSTGIHIWAFANNINRNLMGDDEQYWPTEANDYLNPEFRGKIISTYPNDDDAVLYLYKQIIDKYGWQWLARFVNNDPVFVRSTQAPYNALQNGSFPVSFTTAGSLRPEVVRPVQFVVPEKDPFVAWAQRAAILKGAKNLAMAQLYMSWWLEFETQNDFWFQWSVRKDVPVPTGYRSLFDYPGQMDPTGFQKFMEDRTAVEIFKTQIQLYIGEPQGPIPTLTATLGLDPRKMLPEAFL